MPVKLIAARVESLNYGSVSEGASDVSPKNGTTWLWKK